MYGGLNDWLVKEIYQVLSAYPAVKKAVLFGSRGRGDHKYNSDIDLAVYVEGEAPPGLYLDLDEAAGIYKLDYVNMNTLNNAGLRQVIETEGVQIYP
jgi:predicted nucleotidyltransferase